MKGNWVISVVQEGPETDGAQRVAVSPGSFHKKSCPVKIHARLAEQSIKDTLPL